MIEDRDGEYHTIGFLTFNKRFLDKKGMASSDWFDALGAMFQDLKAQDPRFRRLVAIHTALNSFTEYLDPQHLRTGPSTNFSSQLSQEEAMRIRKLVEDTTP